MSDSIDSPTEPKAYDPHGVEAKWQTAWRATTAFATPQPDPDRRDAYVLVGCPFTSGSAHMGHVRSYSIGDAHARYRRGLGDAVLFSIGFDAFGLPSELGAIDRGKTPREWVDDCAETMRGQFDRLGFSFDWDRTFKSSDPDVYRWTQWLFLTLLEAGLVYERDGTVDWCDTCQTVLARIQAEGGQCWRCHQPSRVIRRTQWYLRTSHYNEENVERLAGLERWHHLAVKRQRAFLGQVAGGELDATCCDTGEPLTIFTACPGQVRAARFVLLPASHPDIARWAAAPHAAARVAELRDGGWQRADRGGESTEVVVTGRHVRVPGLARTLPVVVVPEIAAGFGAGAVLGVPAADRADAAIARRIGIDDPEEAPAGTEPELEVRPAVRYRSADFPISRQRAWGAPIPLVHCDACGTVPVPKDELPVALPDDLRVTGAGNALQDRPDFWRCSCPACGAPARRETETLDCHFDAAWQELPFVVPAADRGERMLDHPELQRWLPVTTFIQGCDTGGFTLDQRTIAKALRDLGPLDFLESGEPYAMTLNHDMVQLGGRKMSKHLGNVVSPQDLVLQAGADAVRFALLYAAAPAKAINWHEQMLSHGTAFVQRLWYFAEPRLSAYGPEATDDVVDVDDEARAALARTCAASIVRIAEDYEDLNMHRAARNVIRLLARIEAFDAEARRLAEGDLPEAADREAIVVALAILLRLTAPLTPHVAEELWERTCRPGMLVEQPWPQAPAMRKEVSVA